MQFRTRIMLAAGCVSLVALSIPAFSKPLQNAGEPPSRAQKARVAQQASKPQKPKVVAQRPSQRRAEPVPILAQAQPAAVTYKKPIFGWPALVAEARKYMGTNPTSRTRLWCATFMNMVLAKAGYSGTNSDAAKSFADYGRRISEPKVGAIAVLTRGKNGGHVGVVSGIDKHGNPIIISGNHNKRVGESVYPRSRVIAYVMPTDSRPATTQVADRGPPNMSRAGSEPGLDSPIAELIAAIEAEQSRPERPRVPAVQAPAQAPVQAQAAVQPRPAPPQRVVEQLSAAPRRVVQQTPEPPAQPRTVQRNVPFKAALADLFGVKRSDVR